MDDMKDKVKGFMKKVNNPFSSSSSSSGKFSGQGRVLGSSPSGPTNPILARPSQALNTTPNPSPARIADSRPSNPPKATVADQNKPSFSHTPDSNQRRADGFDPFDSLITTGKRSQNGYSLNIVECPICNRSFGSEEEVSEHVDSCVMEKQAENADDVGALELASDDAEGRSELEARVGAFLSAKPQDSSVEVMLKLLRNIAREPENAKFRKIRMSNPKIKEAIGDVAGGIELLEYVGFELKDEGGDMWAVMDEAGDDQIRTINKVAVLLEPKKFDEPKKLEEPKKIDNATATVPSIGETQMETKNIDRQVRVFFSVPESVAAKIELPESFYNLSMEEVRRETEMRKKKIAESQFLIPKSYKEKQLKAGRKRYTRTIIRIQFPDGVVLQGVFAPWERTSSLYEFVSSSLKEPCLEFELMHPVVVKRRVIPRSPEPGKRAVTLDDEDLVPSALIKFRPMETDSIVFTGLRNELLEISEPLQ